MIPKFTEISQTIINARLSEYDPWIYRYYKSLETPAGVSKYVRHMRGIIDFAQMDVKGKAVLDAGCGFGLSLVLLGIMGAEKLCGFDLYENMVNTVNSYKKLLPDGLDKRMQVEQADAAAMPYEDNQFDLVISIEAVSHYLDNEAFLTEAHRVLKPGGVLLITDGNNGRNPTIRQNTAQIWEAFEHGEEGQELFGHIIEVPFVLKRERFIKEKYPQLDDQDVAELAKGTSGLTRDDIINRCESFLANGEKPNQYYKLGDLPVDPIKCDVIERLFDPYELAKELEDIGFRTRVTGYWGGASGKPHLRLANSVLSKLSYFTISTAQEFRIAARKK